MLLYLKYVVGHRRKEGIYTHLCDNNSALLLERRREQFENTWVALCSLYYTEYLQAIILAPIKINSFSFSFIKSSYCVKPSA